jgi:acetyl-CoA carboxylase carboxyl transferase subunit alpha
MALVPLYREAPTGVVVGKLVPGGLAAQALSLTARQNLSNGIIDAIVPEPAGGAHRDPRASSDALQGWIIDQLRDLTRVDPDTLVDMRFEKFRRMGSVRSS